MKGQWVLRTSSYTLIPAKGVVREVVALRFKGFVGERGEEVANKIQTYRICIYLNSLRKLKLISFDKNCAGIYLIIFVCVYR